MPMMSQADDCDCKVRKVKCNHHGKVHLDGMEYNNVWGVFDHEMRRDTATRDAIHPYWIHPDETGMGVHPPMRKRCEKIFYELLRYLSIRSVRKLSDGSVIPGVVVQMSVPDDYQEGYAVTLKPKPGPGRPRAALTTEQQEAVDERALLVSVWAASYFASQLGEVVYVKGQQKTKSRVGIPEHYRVTLLSRYCPNAGREHTKNSTYASVRIAYYSTPPTSPSLRLAPAGTC